MSGTTIPGYFHKGRWIASLDEIEEEWPRLFLEQQAKIGAKQEESQSINADLSDSLTMASTAWCERIASHIRCAHKHLDAASAFDAISKIWERVDRVGDLAAARSRLLLGRIEAPSLATGPVDGLDELSSADSSLAASVPSAIFATEKLIRAVRAAIPQLPDVEICKAPMGHVFVNWKVAPNVIQWEILPSPLPWPGVTVRAVVSNASKAAGIQSRIFHNGADVIDHLKQHVESD